ncbi:peptidase C1 [candidate division KSB1 bacterium 4484_188]|nr:MAG: peptidase C1 [candidate division KSB1 bacterium 4484_188]
MMDFDGIELPTSTSQFKQYWHNPPISQGLTGTCWCFSTTSFFESEIYRLTKQKVKLSELYTVYWEYVEKARRFIREHGDSEFGQGSEANAVQRMWRKYGIVPEEDYTGLKPGQVFHDHDKMFNEMKVYLNSLKDSHAWNEDVALATIKSILNYYIGEPPTMVEVNGKQMSPKDYMKNVLKFNPDDYVGIMSLKEYPYYQKVEYKVPDNWWHSKEYYNVPLDVFTDVLKRTIRKGYTVCIGGDVSEPGYNSHKEVAMVPTFDIPAGYIDENARQFRFSNKSTTDDHGIHLVGYMEKDGKDWYLIKDSGSGSRNGKNKGYYFYNEDYVKLKIMNLFLHKSAVKDILKKFKS